jgi:putative CocE/NonD family hydrolase
MRLTRKDFLRTLLLVAVTAAALGAGSTGRAQQQRPLTELDAVLFVKDLMVPMRDGVRLSTDIYRPTLDGAPVTGKLPLLLQQTPYNKEGQGIIESAKFFARHGYVVALQDDRGTYKSEGVLVKYVGFGKDATDTIEYLAKLPYTDGQVGMWGLSYAAHVQASAAIAHPPALKTVVLNFGGLYNGWDYKIRNHGAFELAQQVGWAFEQAAVNPNNPAAREVIKNEKVADWIGVIHGKRGVNPLSHAKNFEDYIFELMTHSDYDDYWKAPDMNWSLNYAQTADIPMLHVTGWYDSYTSGTIKNYSALSKMKKSPIRLLVGPWIHARNTTSVAGDVEFGPDAAIKDFPTDFHLRWFDHFLKGRPSLTASDDAPVRLFVMGTGDGHKDANGRLYHGGSWKTTTAWPMPGAQPTSFYLHGDGSLSQQMPPAGDAPSAYTYDPHHPVPTIGGSFSTLRGLVASGGFDQREREFKGEADKGFLGSRPPYLPLKARPDILVFQTAPLTEDTEVVGPVEVTLYAASTAVDTDFTAKLVDVYPPSRDYPTGYDLNITDGIIRARYRNSPEKQEFMKPGEVYKFAIEPFPTANVFKKGHRIRLDISSSNFPRFDVNPNTGEPLGMNRRIALADNSVYHDARHPSQVVLSIVRNPQPATGGRD